MNTHVATARSNGSGRAQEAAGSPLEELFDVVDDLIRRVADSENPEIRKVRVKVRAALVAARSAVEDPANQPNQACSQAGQVTGSADDVHPGPALGVALLVGLGLGLVASSRQ
jgi:ElaB/YqjD/DUF883 family membrane-anchored ribosome-binding protein